MSYFKKRNKLSAKEFSGIGEISDQLRNRIKFIFNEFVYDTRGYDYGHRTYLSAKKLDGVLSEHNGRVISHEEILHNGDYGDVFELVEITFAVSDSGVRYKLESKFKYAFNQSGSAYQFNSRTGFVEEVLEKHESDSINIAIEKLTPYPEAMKNLDEAIVGMLTRKLKPDDVVKRASLALEEYLMHITETSEVKMAITKLTYPHKIQEEMLKKLIGYRGDAKNVAHAKIMGDDLTEKDAHWYLIQVSSFIGLL